MTADSFYSLSLVLLLNIQNTSGRERDVTAPTIHIVVTSIKPLWHLGIFNFIVRLRQIEHVVFVCGSWKFENVLFANSE